MLIFSGIMQTLIGGILLIVNRTEAVVLLAVFLVWLGGLCIGKGWND
jgi:hypothetical protein